MKSFRIVGLILMLSLSYTPVRLSAQGKSEAVPLVDMDGGCLLGGVINGQWVKPEEMSQRMSGGDKYRLYDLKGEYKTVTGGKPASQGAPCEDTLYVDLPREILESFPAGSHYIGVAGRWNPLPRVPKIESNDSAVYRNLVADLLKRKGIRRPQVNIVKVVRVDLEGDGVDEVIINATRVHRYGNGSITPDPAAGDYSIVMLRKMINGKAQTIMLDEEYHPKAERFTAPDEFDLIAVLDLNGDGIMEIINAGGYYEGNWKTVYSIKGNKALDVLGCGCGA
jgi:ribosomal protein L18E